MSKGLRDEEDERRDKKLLKEWSHITSLFLSTSLPLPFHSLVGTFDLWIKEAQGKNDVNQGQNTYTQMRETGEKNRTQKRREGEREWEKESKVSTLYLLSLGQGKRRKP